MGICQWFHYEDPRLDLAVEWLKRMGVKYLRTGVSWADWYRENAEAWFDRQMQALEPFSTTLTLCFTPEHMGVAPHYTSPPRRAEDFAEFAVWAVRKYAAAKAKKDNRVLIGAS
jgi:beta-xylosidase